MNRLVIMSTVPAQGKSSDFTAVDAIFNARIAIPLVRLLHSYQGRSTLSSFKIAETPGANFRLSIQGTPSPWASTEAWRINHGLRDRIVGNFQLPMSREPRMGRQHGNMGCVGALQIKPRNVGEADHSALFTSIHRGSYPLPDTAQLRAQERSSCLVIRSMGDQPLSGLTAQAP